MPGNYVYHAERSRSIINHKIALDSARDDTLRNCFRYA